MSIVELIKVVKTIEIDDEKATQEELDAIIDFAEENGLEIRMLSY